MPNAGLTNHRSRILYCWVWLCVDENRSEHEHKWRSRLARGVAVFFVLFVVLDIAAGEDCAEYLALMPASGRASVTADGIPVNATRAAAAVSSEESHRGQQPGSEAPHEGDCLGCCAHVLPSGLARMTSSEVGSPQTLLITHSFTSPPLVGAYHPPKA